MRALAEVAREAAHVPRPRGACPACGQEADVLAERADAVVVRHGPAVAKAHAPWTDPDAHRVRIAVAAHPLLAGILLPPGRDTARLGERPVTTWPYGSPVDPADPDAAPWEEAAALLARLHSVPLDALPGPLPAMRGPAKAAAAVARMHSAAPAHPAGRAVLGAWGRLPAWARGEAPAPTAARLCHGDLHLGQLVRHPAGEGPWQLIDVDDLGLGDAAWDLARPAAWFAAGFLAPDVWARFLGAYRAAGGPAAGPEGADPWPPLDVPARALTVQAAALAVARSTAEGRDLDDVERAMTEACARIASLPPELDDTIPS
ncbi:aminoglycoside phosphotransferase family protein [Streptomyces sp. HNM0645]|uniref:phosphotransferase family protein n=1 Tax=Streptomyces sp. HNM0645 TaxID=2782343 RepID=UPI0024B6FDCD|nr:aminoglycoside phosphotransferase family protein [Streptomyces sp. HNM0645]MDI9885661.1 aminoglycoside phosphotransferase family protein [Streptomyces sp. HNM0645]